MTAIRFDDIHFSYTGDEFVLDGITGSVREGEFLCILGGNGSGKSTLAKHVNALLVPDEGSVQVLGRDTGDPQNLYFIRSNAGMVFQNPDDQLVANLIENDVAFGPENLGVPAPELRQRVTQALRQVGLQGFERKETNALSGGQKQRVAIAGILAMGPQILVLDEASAMLDPRGRAGLMRVCHELNDAGMTIIMITHFMEEVVHADRVWVLDGGRVAMEGTPEEVLTQAQELRALSLDEPFAVKSSLALREAGVPVRVHADEDGLIADVIVLFADALRASGGQGSDTYSSSADTLPCSPDASAVPPGMVAGASSPDTASVLIEFQHVGFTYQHTPKRKRGRKQVTQTQSDWGNSPDALWALWDISFQLHEGEFFGVAGHTGSGKSTLIQHMNGLIKPTEGVVLVHGEPVTGPDAAARAGVGMVFQYPEHQLFAATVYEDVTFGPRNLGCDAEEMEERYERAMRSVDLDAQTLRDVSPFELSGGQQRRVAFAGVLAMNPTTLVLDEPVAGLDPKSREDLLQLIWHLHCDQGLTVVMVSHDMNDLARFRSRVLVLNQGDLHALGTPAEVFANGPALKAIGLGQPAAQRMGDALVAGGVPLQQPEGLFTSSSLAKSVAGAWKRAQR